MTNSEWTAYGDACAAHESITIDGVEYTDHDDKPAPLALGKD